MEYIITGLIAILILTYIIRNQSIAINKYEEYFKDLTEETIEPLLKESKELIKENIQLKVKIMFLEMKIKKQKDEK